MVRSQLEDSRAELELQLQRSRAARRGMLCQSGCVKLDQRELQATEYPAVQEPSPSIEEFAHIGEGCAIAIQNHRGTILQLQRGAGGESCTIELGRKDIDALRFPMVSRLQCTLTCEQQSLVLRSVGRNWSGWRSAADEEWQWLLPGETAQLQIGCSVRLCRSELAGCVFTLIDNTPPVDALSTTALPGVPNEVIPSSSTTSVGRWMWAIDASKGKWRDFPAAQDSALEEAYRASTPRLAVDAERFVDLVAMRQVGSFLPCLTTCPPTVLFVH